MIWSIVGLLVLFVVAVFLLHISYIRFFTIPFYRRPNKLVKCWMNGDSMPLIRYLDTWCFVVVYISRSQLKVIQFNYFAIWASIYNKNNVNDAYVVCTDVYRCVYKCKCFIFFIFFVEILSERAVFTSLGWLCVDVSSFNCRSDCDYWSQCKYAIFSM